MNRFVPLALIAAGTLAAALSGCTEGAGDPAATPRSSETSNVPVVADEVKLGGISVPPDVRNNLGITFTKVERRQVRDLLRVPGAFEALPNARHEYRAPLSGHLRLAVAQFDPVAEGQPLFTLDSPDWRRVQHEAVEAEGEIKIAGATLDVAKSRLLEAQTSHAIATQRLQSLSSARVRRADLEAETAAIEASLQRLQAEIDAAAAALDEAEEHYLSRLRTLSSITTLPMARLLETTNDDEPRWRAIDALEVRAQQPGVVESVAVNQGGWRETGELVLVTLDPAALRFHADAPQSELARLRDGMRCRIVPPQGGGALAQDAVEATLHVGLTAHVAERTISVYAQPDSIPSWAKAGVSGYLEIPREDAVAELAIPVASLVQDGLETYFFRRNPNDADNVLPVKADLGPSDGKWVVVWSGVKEGDEIVLDGAYALKLAGGGAKAPEGYHYHADGTLHKNH